MTRRRFALLPLALAVLLSAVLSAGCTSAWWKEAAQNPAMVVNSLDVEVHTLLGSANLIYSAASILLPADKRAETDAVFQKTVMAVNHALAALEDAAQAAQEQHQDHPDLSKQIGDVLGAIQELSSLVDTFKPKTGAAPAPGAPRTVDLTGAYADFAQSKATIFRHAARP